ncbi:reverse transcriptase domain-containing protein [Tanacetum coccineum]
MRTYLKNMEGYKLQDLKLKGFDSIQEMFDRAFKRADTRKCKEAKVEDDKEKAELKQCLEIIPDEEEGDFKTMFKPHVEDKVWRNQQDYKVLDWKAYDSFIVTILEDATYVDLHVGREDVSTCTLTLFNDVLEKNVIFDIKNVEPKPNLPLQEIIILDSDNQPMWKNAKTVAPTPNSAIIQLDVDDNFVINFTHLKMIRENKFDGYLRADPHDHIREFLAICNMFRYGETQSEAVKLMIFPLSLSDEAKTWFNELNEESITSWEQMRRAFINRFFPPSLFNRLLLEIRSFSQLVCESLTDAWLRLKSMLQKCHGHGLTKGAIIQIFYHGQDEPTQDILDVTAGGIFLYKSPNQAFQFLEDKVLFKLDWSTKSQNEHHRKYVAFADGSNSNDDNSRLLEKLEALTIKKDSQFQSLKEELQDMRNK